jgi:hypothetical protein
MAWEYSEQVDQMTDEVGRSAFVTNSEGHKFSLYRIEPAGKVWANFRLSDDSFDQIDNEKLGLFRIDNHEPNSLVESKRLSDLMERLGGPSDRAFEWTPKWVNFLIWHGKEDFGGEGDANKGDPVEARIRAIDVGDDGINFWLHMFYRYEAAQREHVAYAVFCDTLQVNPDGEQTNEAFARWEIICMLEQLDDEFGIQ